MASASYPVEGGTGGGGGSGTVTSVDVSGGTTGLTTSGGPVTTSGTITIGGTLGAANGGTGQTALGNLTDSGTDGIVVTGGTGAVVTSASIAQHVADSTHNGYLSSTDWSTFNAKQAALSFGNLTDVGTDGLVVTGGTGAVIGSGTSIAQHVADSTHNGYLSSTDWSTFNGKQAALTIGNLTDVGTDGITVTGGTGAVIGTGAAIAQHVADSTHNGYLSSTDWSTFNGKGSVTSVAVSGGTTGLTTSGGPVTGSGTITLAGTLAIANGGTGQTSATTAFNALSPMTTGGDLIYGGASGAGTRLANGSVGQVLTSAGGTSAPTWASTTALTTVYQTSSTTAVNLTRYLCNTTSAGFTMTLPNGSAGATIMFLDDASTWATNNLTIAPAAAQTIQGISASGSLVCNLSGAWVELAWDATNSYWVVVANGFQYGPTYSPGVTGGILPSGGTPGATSGSAIGAGFVGEKLLNTGSSVAAAATGAYKQVATVTLTAGVWLLSGLCELNSNSTTYTDNANFCIGTTANSSTGTTSGVDKTAIVAASASQFNSGAIPMVPVIVTTNTPYYLNAAASYSANAPNWTATLVAIRIA